MTKSCLALVVLCVVALVSESPTVEGQDDSEPSKQTGAPSAPAFRVNEWVITKSFVVKGENNKDQATDTEIQLEEGEVIILEPRPDDRWGAHGSDGPMTDYRGHGRTDSLMKMHFRVGEAIAPVVSGRPLAVISPGKLELYAQDNEPGNNVGKIRVKVTVLRTQK